MPQREREEDVRTLAEGSYGGAVPGGGDREMPEPPDGADSIFPAEERLGVQLLHPPIHIMEEHVRDALPLPIPRHDRRRVDRPHPPRKISGVAPRRVDHDQIPLPFVDLIGQVGEGQSAPLVPLELGPAGVAGGLRSGVGEEGVGLGEARGVADGVGAEGGGVFEDG